LRNHGSPSPQGRPPYGGPGATPWSGPAYAVFGAAAAGRIGGK
jgi:hypothetical protein